MTKEDPETLGLMVTAAIWMALLILMAVMA